LRIAVNTRFLLPDRPLEGIGRYTHELVQRMVERHPQHEFVLLFDRPFDRRFVYGPNVTPVVLRPPARHPVLWYLWFEWAVPAALRRHRADVFFSPDSYLSLASPVPTVLTVHDVVPLQMPDQIPLAPRLFYRHFLPRYIRRAEAIVTVSDYTRRSIGEAVGISTDKIEVVYNGISGHFRPEPDPTGRTLLRQKWTDGRPYFLYTGAIHPRKNVPRLLRAFDRFKSATGAPALLLLAGRFAWQTGEVRAAYEAATHRDDIRFLDYVPDDQLRHLMAGALALTYLSLSEGFGLPLVEAMQCDTPVVCSDTTALPEVAGDAALLVDPHDEQAIADALKNMWENPELRHDLVKKGRIQRQKFSWDTAADQVWSLLSRTAQR
jgi:glycosyltransferase involved in cell wall biosynthesis